MRILNGVYDGLCVIVDDRVIAVFLVGVFEITDMFLNAFGAVIGTAFALVARRLAKW